MNTVLARFLWPLILLTGAANAQDAWRVHDRERPNPPVVTPATTPGGAPSDATILFDGHNMDAFESQDGGSVKWQVENGYVVIAPGTGNIHTKQTFGDCQLHVEWASPNPPQGTDQMRGNSGVIIMGMYELQVLDSYNAKTYADGQAGAIYGQYPPLVNATRAPGDWQTYDIIFREPRYDSSGHLVSRARETVMLNGVVVQDSTLLSGPTAYHNRPPYFPLPEKLPLVLQDHGTPVRYRNIWIRELPAPQPPIPFSSFIPLRPDPKIYESYAGTYEGANEAVSITVDGDRLQGELDMKSNRRGEHKAPWQLFPRSDDAFEAKQLPGQDIVSVRFTRGQSGAVKTMVVFLGGHYVELTKK
jgi:hypothetical protein